MLKALFAAGALLAAAGTGALAASPAFCANYSHAAVAQARIAHATPPCAPGATGARWSIDSRVHYSWCITAPIMNAESERAHRTNYLRSCRR